MSHRNRPTATSLPRSPQDDEASRMGKYFLTMGIRIACLILAVLVQPYSWYTWVFAAGAIVLPYFAVVIANVSARGDGQAPESPERTLTAAPEPKAASPAAPPSVIRLTETPPPAARADGEPDDR